MALQKSVFSSDSHGDKRRVGLKQQAGAARDCFRFLQISSKPYPNLLQFAKEKLPN